MGGIIQFKLYLYSTISEKSLLSWILESSPLQRRQQQQQQPSAEQHCCSHEKGLQGQRSGGYRYVVHSQGHFYITEKEIGHLNRITFVLCRLSAGIKSSLRKPAGPGSSSSSSLPGRRTEERSTPASKSQDKPPNQERSHSCSPVRDMSICTNTAGLLQNSDRYQKKRMYNCPSNLGSIFKNPLSLFIRAQSLGPCLIEVVVF